MAYRISFFFLTLFVSFSSLAISGGENFNASNHKVASNNSTSIYEIDSLSAFTVVEEETGSVDCEAEILSSSGEDILLAQAGCCRICTVGKACGNSCISKKYKCHKGKGCACNG